MTINRRFIGLESEDRFIDVEKGQLRLFAIAIGEMDPIYSEEGAAKAAGYRDIPAPPTFAFSLANVARAKTGSVRDMGVTPASVLHGEQSFEYHLPIYAGDRIRLKTKTVDIYEKKGGALEFVVQDTTAHNQYDELCVTSRAVLVIRN